MFPQTGIKACLSLWERCPEGAERAISYKIPQFPLTFQSFYAKFGAMAMTRNSTAKAGSQREDGR